jgi:hypothetical protein
MSRLVADGSIFLIVSITNARMSKSPIGGRSQGGPATALSILAHR